MARGGNGRRAAEAHIGLYSRSGKDGPPFFFVIGISAAADPADFTNGFMRGFAYGSLHGHGITRIITYPPGPHGGSLRCGQGTRNSVCTWTDSSTVAVILGSRIPLGTLAQITLALRESAEP